MTAPMCLQCLRPVDDGLHLAIVTKLYGAVVLSCRWPDRLDLSPLAEQQRLALTHAVRKHRAKSTAFTPHTFNAGTSSSGNTFQFT
jgi:hypothetical protein